MSRQTVVLLGGTGGSTNAVYHALATRFDVAAAVLERRMPRRVFLARRIRRLGLARVLGQVVFQAFAVPALQWLARARIAEIEAGLSLDRSAIPPSVVRRVANVNDPDVADLLVAIDPGVIVVNGTRILAPATLAVVPRAIVLNLHTGITPLYRGVHGAYWALVHGDRAHCGVTVHLIDAGIDTGPIVAQATVAPSARDSFVTYPLLQLGAGLPLLIDAVSAALGGRLTTRPAPAGHSRLWSHPTLLEYLRYRARGVH